MDLTSIFQLPEPARVHITVTKESLKQQPSITTAELKLLQGPEIQHIRLKAVCSTDTVNIEAYQNEEVSFLEVYLLHVHVQPRAYATYYLPVARLLHRLIPHHCMVLTSDSDEVQNHLSLATKKIHKQIPDQRVLDQLFTSPAFGLPLDAPVAEAFTFAQAYKGHLQQLYSYYIMLLQNLQIAAETRTFQFRTQEALSTAMAQLAEWHATQKQVQQLKQRLKKAKLVSEKVALTSQLHTCTTHLQTLHSLLK